MTLELLEPQAEQITPTVSVIDDHKLARDSVAALLDSMDCNVACFDSAEAFLSNYDPNTPGCVVTDVRLRGMSGIELLHELTKQEVITPIIIVTGFANTRLTVKALRNGAVTLLEKPFDDDELWNAIREALRIDTENREFANLRNEVRSRFESLTPQERRVTMMILSGLPNREIATSMNVSVRTVESRRHDVFNKMHAKSVPHLVQLTLMAEGLLLKGVTDFLGGL